MEALVSSLNKMEMETNQKSESAVQHKPEPEGDQNPVENCVHLEKETDEIPGSETNQEPVETCQDSVVESDITPEKQADPEAGLEISKKPTEACHEIAAESDVNPEKQADPEAGLEVNKKPMETCQEKAAEPDNPEKKSFDPGVIYRCKKCRRMLVTQEFIVTHEAGAGGKSFRTGKRSNVDEDEKKPECPCIFVEPMKWMQTVEEGYVSNKIFCMGCKARLGQFNWAGMQCSCGAWVTPAFQLTKSKMDECSM